MTQIFWIGVGLLLFFNRKALLHVAPTTACATVLIGAVCMYPVYLWCDGKVQGMPVFPFFSLTYLWTFCLPLLSENPNVLKYSPEQHLYAGIATAFFLLSGTLVWIQLVRTPNNSKKSYRALKTESAETFFIAIVGAGALLNMYVIGGWQGIPDNLFTIVRGIILGLSFLGIFVLAYRCGEGSLPPKKIRTFVIFLALNILSAAASLILKTALTLFLLSTIAYVIGGRKLPLVAVLIGLVLLMPLHYGKHEMRHKYWSGSESHYVQPWEYPAWFQEWSGYAAENLNPQPKRYEPKKEKKESFIERSSVIHMLMMAQEKIPAQYSYVGGQTYAIIPLLFVPRVLLPNKIRSHEGTHMLNIHIHRQTYQDTLKTTIAWGLLPEAYANFGLIGCAGIGALLGAFYGAVTRLAIGMPAFSARTMFCVLVLSLALASTEWTAGVYAATLFQSSVPILGIRVAFMKLQRPLSTHRLPS
ncbi:hypothetical protein ACN4EK_19690 [Pantanalinema rosaneae CENA516]|uniref:hypothetical protein n=1 Tax=Pantanalinema rosaneae TaxID=1620701 RepID=UPI003D6FDCD1